MKYLDALGRAAFIRRRCGLLRSGLPASAAVEELKCVRAAAWFKLPLLPSV